MKKLILLLAITLLPSCIHQESYRLENLKAKTLFHNQGIRDGLQWFAGVYGVTDPKITSIEDIVNSFTITDWDTKYEKQDYVFLGKTINKGGMVLKYVIRISRPLNSSPSDIEAMGATDQGQFLQLHYIVDERRADEKEESSPLNSTVDSEEDPMLTDDMIKERLDSSELVPTQQSINDMLSKIDRIRVMATGMAGDELVFFSDDESDKPKVLLDTNSKEQIESFKSCFSIVEDYNIRFYCACSGWPTFEFLSGSTLIARVSLHHGVSIRWSEWNSDANLSRNEDLLDWLAANGVPQPKESYEADLVRAEESRKKYEQWLLAVPESIRIQVRELLDRVDYTLASKDDINAIYENFSSSASPESQALTLFEWYGSGCGLWSGYPGREDMPKAFLMKIPTSVLLQALTNDLSDAHIEGAARFFTSREFNRYRYPDRKLLPDDLKKRIREHIKQQKDDFKTNRIEAYLPK